LFKKIKNVSARNEAEVVKAEGKLAVVRAGSDVKVSRRDSGERARERRASCQTR